jgi:hypothetical protein
MLIKVLYKQQENWLQNCNHKKVKSLFKNNKINNSWTLFKPSMPIIKKAVADNSICK